MNLKNTCTNSPVGVIGAGSFGTALANLLAHNARVYLYMRTDEKAQIVQRERACSGQKLHKDVIVSSDLSYITTQCQVLFPVVPSGVFRSVMRTLGFLLKPHHVLIHGIKGLAISDRVELRGLSRASVVTRDDVQTMSEVIRQQSCVQKIGCLAGPNLAYELAQGQPAATVLASRNKSVVKLGQRLLKNPSFQVYQSSDIIGVELCGVLKNIMALASGCLEGARYGANTRALLINRGLVEMIYLGRAMGGRTRSFIGLAGMGDLIATCTSRLSRNYQVGCLLGRGQTLKHILEGRKETIEGIRTVAIVRGLAQHYRIRLPITETMYRVLFGRLSVPEAVARLMRGPFKKDVDFL